MNLPFALILRTRARAHVIFVTIFLVPSCTSYSITEKREIKPQAKPEPTPNNPEQPRAFWAAAQKRPKTWYLLLNAITRISTAPQGS